ncbi:MAG: transglutaminase domain-containing protein [Oscillospiraceae bacterium]|nr:transglutaminase domain-containing protein [Oscillospiraceae bacterium]
MISVEESLFRRTNAGKEAGTLKRAAKRVWTASLLLALLGGCLFPPTGAAAYPSPAFRDSAYHPDLAQHGDRAAIDTSGLSEGYVAASATSDTRLKFQVIKGEDAYTYDLPVDGTPAVFPLQSGSGTYRFRIMENVVDQKYSELYSVTADALLQDEFQPFLRPNAYVNYGEGSACVRLAAEFAAGAATEMDFVNAVYDYICSHVTYDKEKATSVKSGYLPSPDETLQTGKGICFDYASLAAAMLRSQGIPTKMIFGYVAPKDLYHAWNMFYTDETGWVTVGFEANADTWTRIDLTFAASGADAQFIGDGTNYSDLYYY